MKRLETALRKAGYINGFGPFESYRPIPEVLRVVLMYAAQNPGLDFANYGQVAPYRSDARQITKAWREVCAAARECYLAGVTDDDIVKASESAFSGRLTLHKVSQPSLGWRVEYCTGQYWPTEYRWAVAAVLRAAVRNAEYKRAA